MNKIIPVHNIRLQEMNRRDFIRVTASGISLVAIGMPPASSNGQIPIPTSALDPKVLEDYVKLLSGFTQVVLGAASMLTNTLAHVPETIITGIVNSIHAAHFQLHTPTPIAGPTPKAAPAESSDTVAKDFHAKYSSKLVPAAGQADVIPKTQTIFNKIPVLLNDGTKYVTMPFKHVISFVKQHHLFDCNDAELAATVTLEKISKEKKLDPKGIGVAMGQRKKFEEKDHQAAEQAIKIAQQMKGYKELPAYKRDFYSLTNTTTGYCFESTNPNGRGIYVVGEGNVASVSLQFERQLELIG